MIVEFSVPEWSALFRGHFDGEPILSGVSQIFLLDEILRRRDSGRVARRIERVRFKATAGPRETLRFELSEPDEHGRLNVSLCRGEEQIMQGVLRVG